MFFISYPNDFWHKIKIDTPNYVLLLAISSNIPLLKPGYVVQGRIFFNQHDKQTYFVWEEKDEFFGFVFCWFQTKLGPAGWI